MHSFIPHRDNPNAARKIIGILAIVVLSAASVYLLQGFLSNKKPIAKAQPANVSKQNNESVVESNQLVDQASAKKDQETNLKEIQTNEAVVIPDNEKLATTIEEAMAQLPIGPRSKDPKVALTEAKTYARPQITEGKYIDVSLSHQNMVLFENGQFVDSYLISSGKRGLETPMGTFHIVNKVPRAWSKRYGLYMPNWMALVPSGEFGIHELPEWPGGYKEGANHLGIPVSHGCVRLGIGPAKRVFDWAEIGTTVIIHK